MSELEKREANRIARELWQDGYRYEAYLLFRKVIKAGKT